MKEEIEHIAITEKEFIALIKAADSPKYLPCAFGGGHVWILTKAEGADWAIRKLAEIRGGKND